MNTRSLAIAFACGGAALLIAWVAATPPAKQSPRQSLPDQQEMASSASGNSAPESSNLTSEVAHEEEVRLAPHLPLAVSAPGWEAQVEALLRAPGRRSSDTARTLLALLPSLPEEALSTVTEAAVLRLNDDDYAAVKPLLFKSTTHGQVLSALFADLLERPDEIALPALLAIARTGDHPFAEAAQDNLSLLLDKDHGGDWPLWEAEITAILANTAAPGRPAP